MVIRGENPLDRDIFLTGKHCKIVPFQIHHAVDLYNLIKDTPEVFDYLRFGPFNAADEFIKVCKELTEAANCFVFAILDINSNTCVGTFSYLDMRVSMGVLEVGFVLYSKSMQRKRIGTEAMYLIINHAFETMNCRRVEWKCDNLNEPSKAAALRYGFTYEGTFRQHMIMKGRNRDSAWFSMLDHEWRDKIKQSFLDWLKDENFANDIQIKSLQQIRG